MAHTEITVYPKGIEVTVLVEGNIVEGGSNSYGSDEPEWTEIQDMVVTRPCGRKLSPRLRALLDKEYGEHMGDMLIEANE